MILKQEMKRYERNWNTLAKQIILVGLEAYASVKLNPKQGLVKKLVTKI